MLILSLLFFFNYSILFIFLLYFKIVRFLFIIKSQFSLNHYLGHQRRNYRGAYGTDTGRLFPRRRRLSLSRQQF